MDARINPIVMGVDLSWRKCGIFVLTRDRSLGSAFIEVLDVEDDSLVLKRLKKIFSSVIKNYKPDMICFDYTPVPKNYSIVAKVNRVVGVFLEIIPRKVGWAEVSMSEVYSYFKIKNVKEKKKRLHKLLTKKSDLKFYFKNLLVDFYLLKGRNFEESSGYFFDLSKIPEDIKDAFFIAKFVIEKWGGRNESKR